MRAWAAVLFFAILLVAAPAAHAKRVRVFAVGPKFDLGWVDTREHYRAKLLALTDARERGRVPATIQKGAGDVASRLLGGERDLVALPEDIGLMAALSGSRGMGARQVTPETGGLTAAIGSLLVSYAPVAAHYGERYPHLQERGVPTRLLTLSLTDTFGRVAVETFAELADRYDAYLEAGVNMARDWRIVCSDKATFQPPPGATGCDEQDPLLVARLRDPDEPQREYAYEATTDQPVNMALVFGPDGRLISKQVKTYLTPVELPGQLDLVPGDVSRGLGAVRTPVGTLGFVTSKDAWMPDVTAKLDARGVDVLVQPEFFVNDTIRSGPGMWAADTLKASGYADLLRHPSIEALVLPELTGNVYDFSADAQQHIAVKPRSTTGGPRGHLVGQEPAAGFAQVQPWAVPDPLREGEPMAERRRRLGAAGDAMSPTGSGPPCPAADEPGPCRGGQAEGVLAHDIEVAVRPRRRPQPRRKRGRTRFSVNRPIAPSRHEQRNVTLAARGRRVYAAWEERGRIRLARSRDGGRTWSRPATPVRPAPGQWWPALAVGRTGRVWLAWQDEASGVPRAYYATSRNGRRFTRATPMDRGGDAKAPQWRPALATLPDGGAYAAWIDEREPVPGETGLREAALYGARLRPLEAAEAGRRLDRGEPVALAQTMDHSWAPDVAASGNRIAVTWIDFRAYDWDVYLRTSTDGGETFGDETTVNRTPEADEALNDTPRATWLGGEPWVAWTDFRKRESSAAAHPLQDVFGGADQRLDAHAGRDVLSFAPAVTRVAGGRAFVAWQDHPRGPGDVAGRVVDRGGSLRRVVRIDDTGAAGSNQWRPKVVAIQRRRVLVAWEDERDGPPNVFAAVGKVARLR